MRKCSSLVGLLIASFAACSNGKTLDLFDAPEDDDRPADASVRDASLADAGPGDGGSTDAAVLPDAASPACTAMTCAGCCMNDLCQTGTTNAACGKGARACSMCTAPDACLPAQVCGLRPEQEWVLAVQSASINAKNPTGGDWDFPNPAPDPFLMSGTVRLTATISDSYSAAWPYVVTLTTSALLSGGFYPAMFDEDVAVNDQIAPARSLLFTEADLRKGFLEWTGWGGCARIRWTVKPKP